MLFDQELLKIKIKNIIDDYNIKYPKGPTKESYELFINDLIDAIDEHVNDIAGPVPLDQDIDNMFQELMEEENYDVND
jgi:hypothetical protein